MKNKVFLFAFITLLFCQNLFAGTQYYRLSFRDDPSTTIVVGWSNLGTSTNAQVYYGTTDFGTNYQSYPSIKGIDRTVNHKGLDNQFARLTGLTPNTVYYFVVHDNEGTSARMIFKTLPDNANTPITFVSGGDSRTGVIGEYDFLNCRTHRQEANTLVSKIRPSFIAFSGDYVFSIPDIYIASTNAAWADFFTDWQLTITPDGQLTPLIPAFGNHELSDDVYNMFDVPNNSTYYSLSIGGKLLRLYTLNTELNCDATQQSWLSNDLQLHTGNSSEPYWKYVQYHYPFVPHAYYTPNTTMITCWASLFQTYKVKLVSESHAHIIKYTWPIVTSSAAGSDNGFIRDDANGIVYIGEGSWGAPLRDLYTTYSADAAFNWTRNQEKMPGFQIICMSKQKIEVRVARLDNVAGVGQVQLTDPPCTLPANIVLWNPSNGGVITINNTSLSSDATLMTLSTSEGTLNPVFNPSALNYTVNLPSGTTIVPTVTATLTDPNATLQVTQATNLTGSIADRTAIVQVIAEDGITTKVYSVLFSVDPSGINNITAGSKAIVYPNPGNGIFNIEFFDKQQKLVLEVYNSMGRHITTENISTKSIYKLDLSKEETGTYFLYIKNEKLLDRFKVVLIK